MKILFLNHNVARRGGTFYRAFHVARRLVSRGHSVTLLTISADRKWGFEREVTDGVEIVHTPDLLRGVGRSGWDLWDAASRIAFLRRKEWHIVHAWDCRPVVILPALYAKACSHPLNGKLVIDWCDWWGRGGVQSERPDSWAKILYSPLETFFEEAFRTKADATTVASEVLGRRALSLGVSSRHMLVLPGGADTEAVYPRNSREARSALNLPPQSWLIGYMGAISLTEVDLLLGCVRHVREADPNVRLLAVGVSVAGSGRSLTQVAGAQCADWIIETGRVPFSEVSTYLAACNALVLPLRESISNSARWPSKINDYLASGRPVVATRVGAIVQFLERAEAGVLTHCDSLSIAGELLRLRSDPVGAAEIGARGRRLAEGDLNWTAIVDRLNDFYAAVLNDSRRQIEPALVPA